MDSLQEWKAALASGVKIETLLGLDSDRSKSANGEAQPTTKDEPQNIGVKTSNGQLLEFQWSTPSLSAVCPDLSRTGETNSSSPPSNMVVSPPSIPVKQILGPCFIDLSSGHDKEDEESKASISKDSSPD